MSYKDIPEKYLPDEVNGRVVRFYDGTYSTVFFTDLIYFPMSDPVHIRPVLIYNEAAENVPSLSGFSVVRNIRVRLEIDTSILTSANVTSPVGMHTGLEYCLVKGPLDGDAEEVVAQPGNILDKIRVKGPTVPYSQRYQNDEDHAELFYPGPIKLYAGEGIGIAYRFFQDRDPGEGITTISWCYCHFTSSYFVKF